jgi:Zn-dependent membrane protease YugP
VTWPSANPTAGQAASRAKAAVRLKISCDARRAERDGSRRDQTMEPKWEPGWWRDTSNTRLVLCTSRPDVPSETLGVVYHGTENQGLADRLRRSGPRRRPPLLGLATVLAIATAILIVANVFLARWAVGRFRRAWRVALDAPGPEAAPARGLARRLLDQGGLTQVTVRTHLADWGGFEPATATLWLPAALAERPTRAAQALAVHEAGHAHQQRWWPASVWLQPAFRWVALLAASAGTLLALLGLTANPAGSLATLSFGGALAGWLLSDLFALLGVVAERDASRRGLTWLLAASDLDGPAIAEVQELLAAAAFTYFATPGQALPLGAWLVGPGRRGLSHDD